MLFELGEGSLLLYFYSMLFVYKLWLWSWLYTTNHPFFVQLVYKVKLDFVLEQLASASVGGYGQDVWSELVEEAKTNLLKITVSIAMFFCFLSTLVLIYSSKMLKLESKHIKIVIKC